MAIPANGGSRRQIDENIFFFFLLYAVVTNHNICLSLGVAQVGIQPVHELLHLLPVEEDDENQEQKVEHTQTLKTEEHDLQQGKNL